MVFPIAVHSRNGGISQSCQFHCVQAGNCVMKCKTVDSFLKFLIHSSYLYQNGVIYSNGSTAKVKDKVKVIGSRPRSRPTSKNLKAKHKTWMSFNCSRSHLFTPTRDKGTTVSNCFHRFWATGLKPRMMEVQPKDFEHWLRQDQRFAVMTRLVTVYYVKSSCVVCDVSETKVSTVNQI